MDQKKLNFLKNILNELKVTDIQLISERTVLLNFSHDIVLYIDALPSGVDFSLEARTYEAEEIIDRIQQSTEGTEVKGAE